jgi:hypothetical protein
MFTFFGSSSFSQDSVCRQGGHQVAQNSTRAGFPLSSANVKFGPARSATFTTGSVRDPGAADALVFDGSTVTHRSGCESRDGNIDGNRRSSYFWSEVIMKRLLLALVVIFLWSASAKADCWRCYREIDSSAQFCGETSFNSTASCESSNGVCRSWGVCTGPAGPECTWPCVQYRWACGSHLPEKARWVVASVKIERPVRTAS